MDENNTFVKELFIYKETLVPSSIFCLFKLQTLHIEETPFQDSIVSDALGNLKQLRNVWIYNSSITTMTAELGTLINMRMLILDNCSLTHMPNLRNLRQMWCLKLGYNLLSHIDGIPAVKMLLLPGNLFKQIPITQDRDIIQLLDMSHNPLSNAAASIMSYKNLEGLYLTNTSLTSIPATIDKLQKLKYIRLSDNKLTYLPTNVLNLRHLEEFAIDNNLLSTDDIESIQKAFKKSYPNLEISI